jgi:hypothetical protein
VSAGQILEKLPADEMDTGCSKNDAQGAAYTCDDETLGQALAE